MNLNYIKTQAPSPMECAPIAKAFAHDKLDPAAKEKLVKKFEIALSFFLAKEKFPFTKFLPLCEMEARQSMEIGSDYKNDHACASFVHFIALGQLKILKNELKKCNFLSSQSDSSSDAANKECEFFMLQYLDSNGQLHIQDRFLTVKYLESATGEELYKCFDDMVSCIGIQDLVEQKLVGFGCDGTNANIADGGLKGHLVQKFPAIVVTWCLSHRVELAVKGANFLMRLLKMYYLYEKSPKSVGSYKIWLKVFW